MVKLIHQWEFDEYLGNELATAVIVRAGKELRRSLEAIEHPKDEDLVSVSLYTNLKHPKYLCLAVILIYRLTEGNKLAEVMPIMAVSDEQMPDAFLDLMNIPDLIYKEVYNGEEIK